MQLRLTAALLAATLAWSGGSQVAGAGARVAQAPAEPASAAQGIESAKAIFQRAWDVGFPSAAKSAPYVLKASFTARGSSGAIETGSYTDTWLSETQWRREAVLGKSRFVRSRNGKKRYRLDEGPDAALLQFVLTVMEPLPAADSVRDTDWRIDHEQADGVATVRVASGHENPDGSPDPEDFIGYWFDGTGQLVKTYSSGLETRRSKFADFNGIQVARLVEVLTKGAVGMRLEVIELGPAGKVDTGMFTIKKHEWDSGDRSTTR